MDYTLLYETFQYGKQYAWIFVRNEIIPELKMRVAKLKRMNQKNEDEAKRIALMLRKNPLHGSVSYTPFSSEEQEEVERISYEIHFSHQVDERQTQTY